MSFAAKVPHTRRSRYNEYKPVSATSPVDSEGGGRRPKGSPAPRPSPFLNRGSQPTQAQPQGQDRRQVPQAHTHPLTGRPLSSSSIDGRGTPTRISRLNRPKSIEEISQALGDPRNVPGDEEQVVVMVMARAAEDGSHRIVMPDSGSDDPGKQYYDQPDMSAQRQMPGRGPRGSSVGRPPSTTSSMPDEFFLPMGGPQLTSSRLSQNAPHFFRYPASNQGYPSERYFPTIGEENYASPDFKYSFWDIFVNLVSVGTYLSDVGTDIFVAYLHFHEENWWWFSLTLAFVLVPSLIITAFSLAWYYQDHTDNKQKNRPTASYARWASRLLFHMLQLGPIIRYIDTIFYGCKSKFTDHQTAKKLKQHWYDLMLYEDTDSCMLRLIECFMEAAPQLVLQLYIMTRFGTEESTLLLVGQSFGCVTSLCSLAWSLVSYNRALRMSLDDKANMSILGMALQFFWHMFIIAARVLALALFASLFTFWVAVLGVAHGIMMLMWILWQSTDFCHGKKCQEFFFNVTIAAVYVFAYLNLQDGHTRLRYVFYYCIIYLENCIMIMVWYMFSHTETTWYTPLSIVVVLVGFLIGVVLQVLYYLCAHPNNFPPVQPYYPHKRIRMCLNCNELLNKPKVNFSAVELRDVHRVLN